MIGIIILIVLLTKVYKSAESANKKGWIWVLYGFGAYLGVQLAIGLGYGLLLGIGEEFWGWDGSSDSGSMIFISIIGLVLSVVAILVVNYLAGRIVVSENADFVEPPPPPTFS